MEREELNWRGGKNRIDIQFWKSGRDGIGVTETGKDKTLHRHAHHSPQAISMTWVSSIGM